MEFSVYERLALLQVLPSVHQHGSFIKLKTLNGLMEDIGFDETELTEWEIRQADNARITWNETKAQGKEIETGPVVTELITDALRWLDENERLDRGLLALCEKFGYTGLEEQAEQEE
jgi:hypothetical protein